jgi:hypothetical protein
MPLSFHPPAGVRVFEAGEFFHTSLLFTFQKGISTRIETVPQW